MDNLKRVNLNLSKKILSQLDDYANELNLSRTAAITFILNNYFTQTETMLAMKFLANQIDDQPPVKDK